MKIRRLDLMAFGPFTNRTLNFDAGHFGLHLVFGTNEAGKSTSLRALQQWLYGIPGNSKDNFLHPYSAMRIGGVLESASGEQLEFIRKKGVKNTLRTTADKPVDDAALAAMLGGVDAEAFHRQFGISHAELRRGGEAVVSGKGDLGTILFAAGSGLADLGQIQKGLVGESDELFTRTGRKQRIPVAIGQLADLRRAIRDFSLSSADWNARDAAFRNAQQQQQQIESELRSRRTQASRWERLLNALPLLSRRKALSAQLDALQHVRRLPETFSAQRIEVQRQLRFHQQAEQKATETIAQLNTRISQTQVPEELLNHRTIITQLHTQLGGIQKAAADRPQLVQDAETAVRDLSHLLDQLGHPAEGLDLEFLRISKLQRQRIQSLAADWRPLLERQQRAAQQEAKCLHLMTELEDDLAQLPPALETMENKLAIKRIQKAGDLDKQILEMRHVLVVLEEQAQVLLQQLRLWSGSLLELERLPVPALETIERFENETRDLQDEQRRLTTRNAELAGKRQQIDQKLEQLRLQHDIPSEDDLREARASRNEQWRAIENWITARKWEADGSPPPISSLADVQSLRRNFQIALELADSLADRLRREADRIAEKSTLASTHQTLEREQEDLVRQLREVERSLKDSASRWKTLWQPLNMEPLSPREMRSWLGQQQKIAAFSAELRTKKRMLEQLESQRRGFRQELLKLLPESAPPENCLEEELTPLMQRCETFCEQSDLATRTRQQKEDRLKGVRSDFSLVRQEMEQTQSVLKEWTENWSDAVAMLKLEQTADPTQATSVLETIDQVFQRDREVKSLRERIAGIDRDEEEFRNRVQQLLDQIAPDLHDVPPHQAVADLFDRLSQTISARARQDEWEALLIAEEEKLRIAKAAVRSFSDELMEMCRLAGCDRIDQLPELEQQSEIIRRLEQEFEQLSRQLQHQAGGGSLDDLVQDTENANEDELKARLAQLQDEISQLEQQKNEAVRSLGENSALLQQMNGSPQAAAAQEQLEQILAQIQSDAEQYIRLKLASVLLQKTVDRFREASQGPVLKRACELFSQLTLERFSGIRPEYDDKGEAVLVGIRASDSSEIHVASMSDGTCDQLYLALRVALLEQSLQGREPIPLIVDDILVMFDDDRATAALRVLAELSAKTQVILFTHHARVVELAKELREKETVFVHSLSS